MSLWRRRRRRKRQKSNRFRLAKQQLRTCTALFVHFSAVNARLRPELPYFTFHRQREHTVTNFSFSPKLNFLLKNSTPGKFAYIGQGERVGIIAPKFQRTRSHFLSDVLAAVAVVVS